MNIETLKQDLCARLPYGVKLFDNHEKKTLEIDYTSQTYDFRHVGLKLVIEGPDRFKPILFPISCLTQEITVNGETFVPVDDIAQEWKKINGEIINITVRLNFTWWVKFEIINKAGDLVQVNEMGVLNLPLWIIDMLNKWHINYRLAPEQFIEATNEYA